MKTVLENYAKENNRLPNAQELEKLAKDNGLYSGENKYQIEKLKATETPYNTGVKEIATSLFIF